MIVVYQNQSFRTLLRLQRSLTATLTFFPHLAGSLINVVERSAVPSLAQPMGSPVVRNLPQAVESQIVRNLPQAAESPMVRNLPQAAESPMDQSLFQAVESQRVQSLFQMGSLQIRILSLMAHSLA